jgi:TPR repeat protein
MTPALPGCARFYLGRHVLAATTLSAVFLLSARGSDNIYHDSARQREHDAYIHLQMENNTRYVRNADSAPKIQWPVPQPQPAVNYSHEMNQEPEVHQETHEEHFAAALKLGRSGNLAAKREAATCYYAGFGVGQNKAEAYRLYGEAASAGDGEAAMYAGSMAYNGDGIPVDREQGLKWLQLSAQRGYAGGIALLAYALPTEAQVEAKAAQGDFGPMQFYAADLLAGSHGRPKDPAKAVAYYQRISDAGNHTVDSFLAGAYYDGDGVPQDWAKAEQLFSRAAAAGDAEAAYWLVMIAKEETPTHPRDPAVVAERAKQALALLAQHPSPYNYGLMGAVEKAADHIAQARGWFARACAGGDTFYEGTLGTYEWYGMGGPVADEEGFKHLVGAAGRGEDQANFVLGLGYEQGWHGLKVDLAKALALFEVAAQHGNVKAQGRLAWAYYNGLGTPVAYDKAVQWARHAADAGGDGTASYVMALAYETGNGVQADPQERLEYLEQAAAQGEDNAYGKLAVAYFSGQGAPQDYDKAAEWAQKAAAAGDSKSMYMMALFYRVGGAGVPKDTAKCVDWMQKAADKGDDQAMQKLAIFYRTGEGVPVNPAKSVEWMKKAADAGNDQAKAAMDAGYTGS